MILMISFKNNTHIQEQYPYAETRSSYEAYCVKYLTTNSNQLLCTADIYISYIFTRFTNS